MQAVLLAGGLGTRLRPLTDRQAKLSLPMLNEPLITYELRGLAKHGITDVILTTSYQAATLTTALERHWPFAPQVWTVVEQMPLGTAGAIKNVEGRLGPVFLAGNADYVRDMDWSALLRAHGEAGAAVTIALCEVKQPEHYGLVRTDGTARVLEFVEKTADRAPHEHAINAGAYVMNREVLERVPPDRACSNEYDLFPGLLADGVHVHSYAHRGYWLDVGRIDQYLQAHFDLLDGTAAGLRPPAAAVIEDDDGPLIAPACLGGDCRIAPDARVGPYASLGAGCAVGPRAEVARSVLWDRVTVGEAAVVRDSVLCTGAMVAPGAQVVNQVIAEAQATEGRQQD